MIEVCSDLTCLYCRIISSDTMSCSFIYCCLQQIYSKSNKYRNCTEQKKLVNHLCNISINDSTMDRHHFSYPNIQRFLSCFQCTISWWGKNVLINLYMWLIFTLISHTSWGKRNVKSNTDNQNLKLIFVVYFLFIRHLLLLS